MIKTAEYLLIRFQNRFGIPKWRLLVGAWCLQAMLGLLSTLLYSGPLVPRLVVTLFVVTMWCLYSSAFQADQETADRRLSIVPNKQKASRLWAALRWLSVVGLMVDFVPPIRPVDALRSCLLIIGTTLFVCDTFPMVGPSLKDRIKSFFTFSKTEPARHEV